MATETFRYYEYSDSSQFTQLESGKIQLKEYIDNLVFLANFDSTFEAQYGSGDLTPNITNSPSIKGFDAFTDGQHGEITGIVEYEEEIFRTLLNEGTIRFFIRSGFENAYGQQFFSSNTPTIPSNDDYSFKLSIDDTLINTYTVSLTTSDTITDVYNAIAIAIAGSGASALQDGSNYIYLQTDDLGRTILIEDPDTGDSLLDILDGVEEPNLLNGPSSDLDFFKLYNGNNNENAIILTHTTGSHMLLKMYDNAGNLDVDVDLGEWNNKADTWYLFELNFNSQLGQFYIDGIQQSVFATNNLNRSNPNTYLILTGNDTDYHKLDELIVFNTYIHNSNFSIPTDPLLPYTKSNPYVDVYFGDGFSDEEIKDLNVIASGCHFTVKVGSSWYYYLSGSWRHGNGTYSQSNSLTDFETKFTELYFDSSAEIIIRTFFTSDGFTLPFLDLIQIITEKGASSQAIITGDISITDTVDLSVNKHITITTDSGTAEVDLSSEAADPANTTLEEIIAAINAANISGLEPATYDDESRIVLQSSTSGTGSYVKASAGVTTNALSLVWGTTEEEDYGDAATLVGTYVDYSELFRWVRSRLGAPLVPVELTDEQLEDCLSSAVYHYNKWRNFEESIEYLTLGGNASEGYDLPAVVPGITSITEIVMQPKYPINYYAGRNDLMANIFIKEMFGSQSIMRTAADYHISLVVSKDLNLILGTQVKWEFIGKKLFIYPHPNETLKVGIKYKTPLSIDRIVNEQSIRDLTLAEAKITLGNIRSTFGNQIPGGDGFLQLNGSELKSEGMQEKQEKIDGLKRSTGIYEFMIV